MKNKSLEQSATRNFIRRSPNFFKSFSAVTKAKGFSLSGMSAAVGMTSRGKITARSAIDNMSKQEDGGVIDHGLDYLSGSRKNLNTKSKVKAINFYNKNKVVSGRSRTRGGSLKSKFVARAFRSLNENKPMFFNSIKGNYLMSVQSIKKSKRGKVKIKSRLLLKSRKGAPVNIKATHFTREAAEITIRKIERFYHDQAHKQFKRALNISR
ncbi:hypothetical protein HDC90_001096 [Pedobacter sp. AK013]|uniref:hypothetical protein n=1 Tax=Pedobacter sp. AK013 TaxID=2723071 RepID=UPI0016154EA6|nr:hypothetical protein [Pedobacter sp. AK013]MBB6236484.1 hypothetical protein [Pedobacter sp. AK013]